MPKATATAEPAFAWPWPAKPKVNWHPNSFQLVIGLVATSVLAGLATYSTLVNEGPKRDTAHQPQVVEVVPPAASPVVVELPSGPPSSYDEAAAPPVATAPKVAPVEQARVEPEQLRSAESATIQTRHTERPVRIPIPDPRATTAMARAHPLIAEARRYLGTNPTGRSSEWCGVFMDMVLRRAGYKGGGNLASAYARYGTRISGPQIGAIAVMWRKGGGHVGIVTGIDANGNLIILSGNHSKRVAEAVYPRSRIYAYVVP